VLFFLVAVGATAVGAVQAHRVAFERAYVSTPHGVEHVGVAPPPAATQDDRINAVLDQLAGMAADEVATIQHALHRAGLGAPDGTYGTVDDHTRLALAGALHAASRENGIATPKEFVTYLKDEQKDYFASIADSLSIRTEKNSVHDEIDTLRASSDLEVYLRPRIGRDPTSDEVARFVSYFNAASASDPLVTVTRKKPTLDEDGLPVFVDGKEQYSDIQTTTSGGVDVGSVVAEFVADDQQLRDEAAAYAYVGYGNALMCAIGSPTDDC
jgi:hypothetical protein